MEQRQYLSAVDFERSENDILLVPELREFLHSQGHFETISPARRVAALEGQIAAMQGTPVPIGNQIRTYS